MHIAIKLQLQPARQEILCFPSEPVSLQNLDQNSLACCQMLSFRNDGSTDSEFLYIYIELVYLASRVLNIIQRSRRSATHSPAGENYGANVEG